MREGRGSALIVLVAVAAVFQLADAAVYKVGDERGWFYDMVSWPNGKSFKAGDVLVFNYNKAYHNVVAAGRKGYTECVTPAGSKVYQSGKDEIRLVKGLNYFICNFPGHCESDMKIAVNAH